MDIMCSPGVTEINFCHFMCVTNDWPYFVKRVFLYVYLHFFYQIMLFLLISHYFTVVNQ